MNRWMTRLVHAVTFLTIACGAASLHARPTRTTFPSPSPSPAAPRLRESETRTVEESLRDRACSCPCGLTLQECFGCSVAKDDVSLASKGARSGETAEDIRRRLDAPIQLVVWMDFTDPDSLDLDRICHQVEKSRRGVVRVLHRHAPTGDEDLWRDAATAVELARELELFDAMHDALQSGDPASSRKQLLEICRKVGIPAKRVEDALATDRYASQLDKDLRSPLDDYDIPDGSLPALLINEEYYSGVYSRKSVDEAIDRCLMRLSR